MNCFHQLDALRNHLAQTPSTALVPTMGNLHQGHLTLVKRAADVASHIVVSIYVNPTQFGPNEDLDNYPRTLAEDLQKLTALEQELGITLSVWTPDHDVMYPFGITETTRVNVPGLSEPLCGGSRPTHFSGVATVVSKLFLQTQPAWAIFGEKDYQQLCVIRRLCQDMGFPIQIIGVPTQRDADGLALSSRNQYLSAEQRQIAAHFPKVLQDTKDQFSQSPADAPSLLKNAIDELQSKGFKVDYLEIRHSNTLESIDTVKLLDSLDFRKKDWRIFGAVYLGKTRLIDNI